VVALSLLWPGGLGREQTIASVERPMERFGNEAIVCLVCLLGVTLSAALLPHVSTGQPGRVSARLE
jgi:hypothetical protein